MKKIFFIAGLVLLSNSVFSQALGYTDLAQLFSRDDYNGSARFEALSGAFGALGGDISAMTVNPAGLSVFSKNLATVTFQSRNNEITSLYYGNSRFNQEELFNISNAGAVLVFDDIYSDDWSNLSIGVNYRIRSDFEETFFAEGNSGFPTFDTFNPPNGSPIPFNNADNQRFSNFMSGNINELNVGISALHKEKLHVGFSVNLIGLDFRQQSILRETNNDGNNNTLSARLFQDNVTTGNGFSFTTGLIYKPTQTFRLGVSYQSPTWFSELAEDFIEDTDVEVSNSNSTNFDSLSQFLFYRLRTPSRVTLSSALVFGKIGLISFDYSSRNFQNLNLSGDDFIDENQFFDNNLRRTNNFNIGTEWRFSRLSLRGGYRYQESPDANALDSDNIQSYSLGLGYNFGSFKIDLSYSDSNRTAIYNFYPQYPQVEASELNIDNKIVAATLTVNL